MPRNVGCPPCLRRVPAKNKQILVHGMLLIRSRTGQRRFRRKGMPCQSISGFHFRLPAQIPKNWHRSRCRNARWDGNWGKRYLDIELPGELASIRSIRREPIREKPFLPPHIHCLRRSIHDSARDCSSQAWRWPALAAFGLTAAGERAGRDRKE